MLGYGGLVLIERGRSKTFPLILFVAIFAYLWLKKYSFLPDRMLLHSPYFILGLSYIFFRVLHLLIESSDSDQKQHIGFGSYLLYTLNFTTFVSGPIQRYDEFAKDQFTDEPIELGPQVIGLQIERIVRGFFKVNVLAMLWDVVRVDAVWAVVSAFASTNEIARGRRVDRCLSAVSVREFLWLHRHRNRAGAADAYSAS